MGDLVEWLNGPVGSQLVHALILLCTAAAAYLTWRSHDNKKDPPTK